MAGIRPLRRKDPAAETVAAVRELQEHAEQLDRIGLLNGQMVSGVIPSGAAVARFRHSLGRPYVGGFVVGVSDAGDFAVQTPAAALLSSTDIKTEVVVGASSVVASDTTVNLWVF